MQFVPTDLEPGSKKKVVLFILAIVVLCGGVGIYLFNFYQKTSQIQDSAADEIANYSTDISAIKPVEAKAPAKTKKKIIPFEEIFQNKDY